MISFQYIIFITFYIIFSFYPFKIFSQEFSAHHLAEKAKINAFQASKNQPLQLSESEIEFKESKRLQGFEQGFIQRNRLDEINPKSLEWGTDLFSGDGIYLRTIDRDFEVGLHGYLQIDHRSFFGPTPNLLMARRARPYIAGRVFRYLNFKYMPDFGQFRQVLTVDGFLDFSYWSQFRIMAGKFRLPVELEMQQTARENLFIERGLPMNLVPNRGTGIKFYGDVLANRLSYQFGFFTGMRDNTITTDFQSYDGYDFTARVMAHPFINQTDHWLKELGIGVGSMYGNVSGQISNFRDPGQGIGGIYFFQYQNGTVAAGQNFDIAPQFYYTRGPFRAFGEYVFHNQNIKNTTARGTLNHQAWQVAASYILTGENAVFVPSGVIVKHNFDPSQHYWGAVEIKARYNELYVDPHAFPLFADPNKSATGAKGWTVGVNWYFTSQMKAMLDYQQATFQGKGGKTLGNHGVEHLLMTRLQYVF
ncbi:OprO/OprP family phosphate-selective porin [Candidatus Nitrosacidococcus tergens]|uniref:Putative Phosphate-selective porin O and P n=1 Tax=Candidatus Nitrosacidococcus tergens TaxID=553981 RepID=A0A7G1QAG1_9GAMM|nr:porin [Candidatus Nitrosacidococcus tergens]CAB1275993.1 putative Phosphate-selective porin O and P [Candidatus Nitrosacidococcus tergens]